MKMTLANLLASYGSWKSSAPLAERGVVAGSDRTQEWLLPWWWQNYRQHNEFPVIFVDFGLSPEMKEWCKERGTLVNLPSFDAFIQDQEEIDPIIAHDWNERYGDLVWSCRNSWFKKPLACLQTDYETTLWIDLDCEVRGSLMPLFESCRDVSLCKETKLSAEGDPLYNSGVIAFRKKSTLIKDWAKSAFERNHLHRGDQELLSWIIARQAFPVDELNPLYNWLLNRGENPNATIVHWIGGENKSFLAEQIAIKGLI